MVKLISILLDMLFCFVQLLAAQSNNHAISVDPVHHHVVFENDHVRVLEVLAAPGATSPMHTHPALVGISLEKVRSNMSTPDGTNFVFDLHPGQVYWFDEAEHDWEVFAGQVHLVAVEVKSAR